MLRLGGRLCWAYVENKCGRMQNALRGSIDLLGVIFYKWFIQGLYKISNFLELI